MMAVVMRTEANGDEPLATRDLLTRVYLERYGELVGLAALILRDRSLAEEVTQEAYLKLVNANRLRDASRAVSYLRSIVLNLARSRLRSRLPRLTQRVTGPLSPEEAALLAEEHHRVIETVGSLPRRQRECVVLRYYADLRNEEIARTLGIGLGSVKRHLHRAMKTLAERMKVER